MKNSIEKIIGEKTLFFAKQDKRYSSNNFCVMAAIINVIAAIIMFCLTKSIIKSFLFLLVLDFLLGGIFLYIRYMEDKYISSDILWAVSKDYFYEIENGVITFKIKRTDCYCVSGTTRYNSNIIYLSFKKDGVYKKLNMICVEKNNIVKRALSLWINAKDEDLDAF